MVKVAPGNLARINGSTSARKYTTASTLGSQSIDPQKTISDIGVAAPRGAKYSTSTPVGTLVTLSIWNICLILEASISETAITCFAVRHIFRS